MSGKPAGNIVMYWHPIQGEVVILLVISCYGNWDELSVDFNFFSFFVRKDHAKCEFAVHDVFAVDILISTGDGKTKEKDTRTTVYKRTENNYQLKMKASRGLLSYLSIFFS